MSLAKLLAPFLRSLNIFTGNIPRISGIRISTNQELKNVSPNSQTRELLHKISRAFPDLEQKKNILNNLKERIYKTLNESNIPNDFSLNRIKKALTTPNQFSKSNSTYSSIKTEKLPYGFISLTEDVDGLKLSLNPPENSYTPRSGGSDIVYFSKDEFPGLIEALCDSY
jgi:hypothetical protein